MAVRFRYRSSPRFESIDLAGAGAISVRDLRSRILGPALRRHFDLLISDASSNRPFDDDALLIPAGSDLVVKRVPIAAEGGSASSAPRETADEQRGCGHGGDLGEGIAALLPPSEKVDLDNFDDPGDELCPGVGVIPPEPEAGGVKLDHVHTSNKKCSEMSSPRYQNIEGSGLSEAMSKEIVGDNSIEELGLEGGKKEIKTNSKTRECQKMEQDPAKSLQAMVDMDVPTELRCFLCKTIFKDAVMIPCCQHSFCDRCISSALVDMKKCPKCSSTRCTVKDLLPNLSLRQAIEHFLETQPATAGFDNMVAMYAPDVESGIQAKEVSCAPSIRQQEQQLPCSVSATGKGSSQIMPNPSNDIKRNSSIKIRLDGNKVTETASAVNRNSLEASRNVDFQGSTNSSKMYQNLPQDNVSLPIQEAKALGMNTQDGSGFAAPAIRTRKGGRTCYMCGSPNHLIRDCPVASNVHSEDGAFQGDAYGPSNWQGPIFHPLRPYGNMYGTPGIIPFDPGVVPVSPYAVPSYMPPFYGGMRTPYAFMRMGGMPSPVLAGAQQPLSHTGFMDVHGNMKSHKVSSGRGVREYDYDNNTEDYHNEDAQRISRKQCQTEKRTSESYSDEGSKRIRKSHHKDKYCSPICEKPCYSSEEEVYLVDQKHQKEFDSYGRDRRYHYSEKSASELHDLSDNSIEDTRHRSKHHGKSSSRKRDESRAKCESDSNQKSHHRSNKEWSHKERADDVDKSSKNTHRHKHWDHETDHSANYKHDYKVKISSQSSRHSNPKVGSSDSLLECDRWEMVHSPDDDERRDHYHHKRKRIHY